MRLCISSTTLAVVALLSTLISLVQAQSNPFLSYPACAQPCLLNTYALSVCAQDTRSICVCENFQFLNGTTSCVRSSCSAADADNTWGIAQVLCISAKANMTLFYEGTGRSPSSATSSATSTATSSASSANSSPAPKKKLSNGALAGIVVGVVIGLTILAAGTFWFVHNWWTIEEVGPNRSYGGEMGYTYGPKLRPPHSDSTRSNRF